MKNSFDGLISRLNMAKERIGDSQDMLIQTAKSETQRIKKKKSKKQNNQGMWENFKRYKICIIKNMRRTKMTGRSSRNI